MVKKIFILLGMCLLVVCLGSAAAQAASVEINVFDSAVNIFVDGRMLTTPELILLDKDDTLIFNPIFDALKAIEANILIENKKNVVNVNPISLVETNTLGGWDWSALNPVAGDFFGGEADDLLIFYGLAGNYSMIWGLEGKNNRLLQPEKAWSSGYEKWDAADTQLVPGDFNGDGLLDIVGFYAYGEHLSRAWFFKNNGAGFSDPKPWWSSPGAWSGKATQIVSGDFNGDKKDDLLAFYGYENRRSSIWLFKNNGKGFNGPTSWWASAGEWNGADTQILSADFDLDGLKDIMAFYNYDNRHTRAWFFKNFGGGFYAPAVWWDSAGRFWDASATRFTVGDFNGDSLPDVFALLSHKDKRVSAWVFAGKGNIFGDPVKLWDSGAGNWDGERTRIVSGDFDGDGVASSVAAIYGLENGGTAVYVLGPIDDPSDLDLWERQF